VPNIRATKHVLFFRKTAKKTFAEFLLDEKKEKITRAQTPLHCIQHYYTNLVTKLTKPRLHYCSQLHYTTKQNWKLRKTKKNKTLMESTNDCICGRKILIELFAVEGHLPRLQTFVLKCSSISLFPNVSPVDYESKLSPKRVDYLHTAPTPKTVQRSICIDYRSCSSSL
jgi:hypothetical protein